MRPKGVVVVGSISADVTAFPAGFPAGGTVLGVDVTVNLGGKGANQAVAAARAERPPGWSAASARIRSATSCRRSCAPTGWR